MKSADANVQPTQRRRRQHADGARQHLWREKPIADSSRTMARGIRLLARLLSLNHGGRHGQIYTTIMIHGLAIPCAVLLCG